jgi:hypothetical protein
MALLALLCLVGLILVFGRTPTHEGEWHPAQALLPEVRVEDGLYVIRNIRDFSYHTNGGIRAVHYLHQEYAPDALRRVWFGLSHFSGYGLAHSFLSFEFEDGRYLVASVEARMRPDQSYFPLAGLTRRYHKIIVLGTERDIIGLRSHVHGQRLLLYPMELTPAQGRVLFKGMMEDVEALRHQPSFYNTVMDNCTTSLLRHDPEHRLWRGLLDYRVLLPGHADNYALERGWIRADTDLMQLRARATVSGDISPGAPDFSALIRMPSGLPAVLQ